MRNGDVRQGGRRKGRKRNRDEISQCHGVPPLEGPKRSLPGRSVRVPVLESYARIVPSGGVQLFLAVFGLEKGNCKNFRHFCVQFRKSRKIFRHTMMDRIIANVAVLLTIFLQNLKDYG